MKDKALHLRKFENIKRRIELHWLEGFPLWSCVTGLQGHETDNGPFHDWMYSVRQIVDLYRIDREVWKGHSVEYLSGCDEVDDDTSAANNFTSLGDAWKRSSTSCARQIEYSLEYECNSVSVGRDGKEWDKDVFKDFRYKNASQDCLC